MPAAAEEAVVLLLVVQQGFVWALTVPADALAAVRSLVGLVVMMIEEDIVTVVVGSIAAGVAGRAAERMAHCSEEAFDVGAENTADKGAPI